MYQDLYDREKIVKKDASMKFYDAARYLYLETDTSGIVLGAKLLWVRDGMTPPHEMAKHMRCHASLGRW